MIAIFSGFGLLEAGYVSGKNEVNIMIKNALDVVFGGLSYWAVGFGLSFGSEKGSNPFVGIGNFFLSCPEEDKGYVYALFLFQLSFSTTATTIVSGAMAERTKLLTYILFSFLNTLIYCVPAHWIWSHMGFLHRLGVIDVAGCGPVHLVGGMTGLVATIMLGPRKRAVAALMQREKVPISGSVKCILGMFMLW
jgi:ammonia channel protein AmtB